MAVKVALLNSLVIKKSNRIDNAHGDRNLMCTCPPMQEYCEA